MKVVCVSCFNHYDTRMCGLIEYFKSKKYEVEYLITDFNHFSKSTYEVDYGCSKQLHVMPYKKNISPQRLISHYIFARKVFQEIKKANPDLIYCIIPPNSLVKQLGSYRKKHDNCKLIFDVYDSWPESFPYGNYKGLIKIAFKYWARLRDKYISNADMLISVSKSGKDELSKKFGKSVRVIMPAISMGKLPDYNFDIRDKVSFCYLGHVNHITDIELGTKILRGVSSQKKVELHIIGEGQNKENWIKMLNQVGVSTISHGIIFDDEKKRKIFENCDIGLNIPKPEIRSTMALKSVEYMRYGLPFINSGLGDNEEIVREYQIGLNVRDGNVIERILSLKNQDLKLMHENVVNCYREKFIKQDYDEIFSEILEKAK